MNDIEMIILQELDELDSLDCPVILVRTETEVKGRFESNCKLGDEKWLCKGTGEVIKVQTRE